MPIYAYRCETCGHAEDVLQKMSDPQLTVCPSCGQSTYRKQVTAAGFQLKGSGWYVTDFRNGAKSEPAKKDAAADSSSDNKPATGDASAPAPKAADAPAPAPAPAKAPPPAPAG